MVSEPIIAGRPRPGSNLFERSTSGSRLHRPSGGVAGGAFVSSAWPQSETDVSATDREGHEVKPQLDRQVILDDEAACGGASVGWLLSPAARAPEGQDPGSVRAYGSLLRARRQTESRGGATTVSGLGARVDSDCVRDARPRARALLLSTKESSYGQDGILTCQPSLDQVLFLTGAVDAGCPGWLRPATTFELSGPEGRRRVPSRRVAWAFTGEEVS
ncbi:MAG: hypothetical protein M1815_005390 [Lichina confinis]|nr:MAG: hypothetical protein M1815_005390 [Lichina confinis]